MRRTYVGDPGKSRLKPIASPLKRFFAPRPEHALPEGERVYAVGDIHGRLDLFDALIEQIRADNADRDTARTTIILLGDLVDRGPDSAGMVERALRWDETWADLECLLGNHEASLGAVLAGERRWVDSWLAYGGVETLRSYGVDLARIAGVDPAEIVAATRRAVPDGHRTWLAGRPLHIARGDYLFVHAGICPGLPIEEQEARDLLWIREEFLDSRADHGAMIVHGHSIREEIDERPNRIGIDTGAYATGRLTAVGLEAKNRWFLQS